MHLKRLGIPDDDFAGEILTKHTLRYETESCRLFERASTDEILIVFSLFPSSGYNAYLQKKPKRSAVETLD